MTVLDIDKVLAVRWNKESKRVNFLVKDRVGHQYSWICEESLPESMVSVDLKRLVLHVSRSNGAEIDVDPLPQAVKLDAEDYEIQVVDDEDFEDEETEDEYSQEDEAIDTVDEEEQEEEEEEEDEQDKDDEDEKRDHAGNDLANEVNGNDGSIREDNDAVNPTVKSGNESRTHREESKSNLVTVNNNAFNAGNASHYGSN